MGRLKHLTLFLLFRIAILLALLFCFSPHLKAAGCGSYVTNGITGQLDCVGIFQPTGSNPNGNACTYNSPVLYYQGTQYTCSNGSTYAAIVTGSGCTLGGVSTGQIVYNNTGTCTGLSVPTGAIKGGAGPTLSQAAVADLSNGSNVILNNQANTYSTGLQSFSAGDVLLPNHSSDPGTCIAGQIEFNTTGAVSKICLTTNTWTAVVTGQAVNQLTGDVTAGPGSGSVAATLATVNSSPGSCGDATHVCQITTNGKGLTTNQTAVAITAGTGNAPGVNTLSFSATPTFTCGSSTKDSVDGFQASSNVPLTLTGNITSSTLSGCTPGQKLVFLLKQDATGGRTVAMPSGFDACPVNLAVNVTTKCDYYYDGANGRILSAVSDAGYGQVSEASAPGANPVGGYQYFTADNVRHTMTSLNSSGQTHIMPRTAQSGDQLSYADLANVVNVERRSCDIAVGDESGSAITNAQLGPQSRLCYVPAAATIVELDVAGDAGTPNVIVGRNHAGTIANIVSGALATAASGGIACSNTGGTTGVDGATTCTNTLQNTSLSAGDYLELVSGTAGGTAKLMTIHVVYTIN